MMTENVRRAQGKSLSKVMYKDLVSRLKCVLELSEDSEAHVCDIIQDVFNFDPNIIDSSRKEEKRKWAQENKGKMKERRELARARERA